MDPHSVNMVDVTDKPISRRVACARATVCLDQKTIEYIEEGKIPKGDVFNVARIAAIMAAKKTGEIIPLCHNIEITGVDVSLQTTPGTGEITIEAKVSSNGRTGVEMEALTAVSVAALTVYDMCKSVDKNITIKNIHLLWKEGGKSGNIHR
ncbi:MAG: cyclic pyranopterin monophosphate synthase MoaC [Syntrophales bacterium]|nr:cyclic pyranopterin monophosphate synthase MoaC [Syntrophales bacterium]